MPDPVSWMMIEPGWAVVDSGGATVGRVDEIRGDEHTDIFNGLNILAGVRGTPTYVPAESIADIVEGSVRLRLTKDELES